MLTLRTLILITQASNLIKAYKIYGYRQRGKSLFHVLYLRIIGLEPRTNCVNVDLQWKLRNNIKDRIVRWWTNFTNIMIQFQYFSIIVFVFMLWNHMTQTKSVFAWQRSIIFCSNYVIYWWGDAAGSCLCQLRQIYEPRHTPNWY